MADAPPRARLQTRSNDARSSLPVIKAVGRKLAPHEDFYHWVLTLSWTAFFSWVGVGYLLTNAVFGLAFWIMTKTVPFSIRKEIEEDQNTALAILMGSVILGLAIIIASTIHG